MRKIGVAHPPLALPVLGSEDDPDVFLCWLREAIPMADALSIRTMRRDAERLSWTLRLTPNLNDKGTGFGGALAAQATLLGWCWVTLWLRRNGMNRNVVVAEASQRFLAPVTDDYHLHCFPASATGSTALAQRLRERGKGRIELVQQLWCGGTLCLEAEGNYAVLPDA
ncbi:YiiD C-terminal domain-containing protein [Halomonas halocynthiae]|uniref:YiiD C-terminal domain-containing protein n=1 Tax=Halomonas halocynthiae TaxID=176290 RepID=UPI00041717B0|nr:YiiD C-terminal domain-containing protein [Halomonas halocynthiae]